MQKSWQNFFGAPSCLLLILLLLCAPFYRAAAQTTDQTVCSVRATGQPLKSILSAIEMQTDYTFVCVEHTEILDRLVTIDALNSNLQIILNKLAREAQVVFETNGKNVIVRDARAAAPAKAQPAARTVIEGVVSSPDGKPLPGVSVVNVNDKALSSTTGENGSFLVKAKRGDVLQLSFVGYRDRVLTVGEAKQYQVTLLSDTGKVLSDIVVTALGIKKETKVLGYAVQQVSGDVMEKVKAPTAAAALTGRVAGLDIANTSDFFQNPGISLRGQTPLIVIDGIPDLQADVYKINADDIESISVLKGTSAAALYGSIGKNGAILYTTKRGKKGRFGVDVNSSTLVQTGYIRIPKVQTEYGDGYEGVYAYVDGSGSGTEGGGWIWGPRLDQKDPSTKSGYWETPQYNSPVDPVTGKLVPLPFISRGKNNLKNFFQTGVLSTNDLSAYWGGENGTFRVSAGNIYQKGTIPNTQLNNSSFSVAGNYNLTSKLSLDARVTYNREFTNNYPTIGYGPDNILYNLVLWTGADVNVRDLKNYWAPGKVNIQQYNYNNSWYNNPYFQAYQDLNGYYKDNSFGSFSLNYDISPSFSIKARSGFNQYGLDQTTKEAQSYISYSYISPGNFFDTKTNYFDITSDLILSYKHDLGQHVRLNVRLGGSNQYTNYKSLYAKTDGLTIPGFYSMSNSTNPIYSTNTLQENQIKSAYGIADLELYRFIYLSVTGRNDWVSTLPLDHNSFLYPSVSGSVVLSDALKLPDYISFLKVRGSLSQVNSGNISTGNPYAAIQTYGIGTKWNNVPSLTWGSQLISPGLTPSTTRSWETGLVVGFFRNRINLDATYFQNREFNNFANVAISQAAGYQSILVNADVYRRKGWEFVLSATPVKNKDFQWRTAVNFSNNHRWLIQSTYGSEGYEGNLKVGDRMDRIYTSLYEKNPQGQTIYDANGFPIWDPYPRSPGYSDPKWIYGWQNTFTYKQFSFSCSIDGRLGGWIYSTTNEKMWWGGTAPGTANHFRDEAYNGQNTFIAPGVVVASGAATYDDHGNIIHDTRTYAPNTTGVNYVSFMTSTSGDMQDHNNFYYSGTYAKIREVVLTYTLPDRWVQGSKFFTSGSVSVVGNNLLMLAKIPNVDPDAESDNLQTPSLRSYGVNLNFKF
ncbi:MAG TPA: SusC/RagA family TonB-linked outer membrane protein [Dinghuibacter sp.]|uniref:SusC/RagA family TonB-linked outer membrane protein n=1 Tax=Dinghuibacter sp. TaxID=2024697 RepID=UPI002CE236BD|nr:SusC/RagA family TonB-linked outer membrane protein [Dinghuibacter sp.]HTJ12353.1 SusC/RagA family TonB-linked outer membrane protein [Dinghuibacter sp.]